MPSSPDRQQALRRFAELHLHGSELDMVPASSDAGFRSYWRVRTPGEPSRVLMDAPPDKIDCGPFLRIGALLAGHGLPVPDVLASDLDQGFLLLSDLGERTCLETIQTGAAPGPYVQAAIALLVRLQQVPAPDWLPPYDRGPLEAELDLFVDWYLGRHRGIVLSDADQAIWRDARARLVESALAQPQVLVHRDYMLRNLMPPTGAAALPGLLDFQDAGRGPIAYDPICLVKDAFASWPTDDVETWLRSYHTQATAAGVPVPAWAQFRRDADWIGMQRHLKVIGIFARIGHRDGKPRYLTDVPRFFGYLFEVLPAYPELAALADLLRRVAPTDAD